MNKIEEKFKYINDLLDKNIKETASFLASYINPFTTPFFTVLNYKGLTNKTEIKNGMPILTSLFLVISIFHFFLSLILASINVYLNALSSRKGKI